MRLFDDYDVQSSKSSTQTTTLAVMVHKLYADRVATFLYNGNNSGSTAEWDVVVMTDHHNDHDVVLSCRGSSGKRKAAEAMTTTTTAKVEENCGGGCSIVYHKNNDPRITVLDTPALTGVSQARRGYVLLLLEQVTTEAVQRLVDLAPMARQNMAWVGRITHSLEAITVTTATTATVAVQEQLNDTASTTATATATTNTIGCVIWESVLSSLLQQKNNPIFFKELTTAIEI